MMLGREKPTGYYLYREDMKLYKERDDLLREFCRHPNGMAFILYAGETLPRGLKIVPVAASPEGPFVQPPRSAMIQWDYPLIEPLVYYLRPDADKLLRDYVAFAMSDKGLTIFESQGLITLRQDAEAQAQARLAALRNGEGTPIGLCGDGSLRKMMRQIGFAYTREKQAVVLKYEPAKPEDVAKVFVHERYPAMLSFESPNTATVAGEWAALEAAGIKKSAVAARALAVVVHPSNPRRSFTAVELQQVLSGHPARPETCR